MRPEDFYTIDPTLDPLTRWEALPLTWSQLSLWESSRSAWYKRYVLGEKPYTPAAQLRKMNFGNEIGDRIETDITFAPQIERLKFFELELRADFSGVPIAGHIDNCEPPDRIHEFKTGGAQYAWTQAKVDKHRQLDVYAALMHLTHKVRPEDIAITLFWLPTEDYLAHDDEGNEYLDVRLVDTPPVAFSTRRTMKDVLTVLADMTRARKEMREYIVHKLSTGTPSSSQHFGVQFE